MHQPVILAAKRTPVGKFGGSLAEPGAVSWQFSRRGVVLVDGSLDEDSVMAAALEAGADDVQRDGDSWRVLCEPSQVWDVRDALDASGVAVQAAENTMVASTSIEVADSADARNILRIMDALEDNDDVQDVYANFDIDDSLMQEVG